MLWSKQPNSLLLSKISAMLFTSISFLLSIIFSEKWSYQCRESDWGKAEGNYEGMVFKERGEKIYGAEKIRFWNDEASVDEPGR